MSAVSAAHPTLPLPSYVRVTNLANNRSIVVRVNDRGPYAHDRVIDVSVKTAELLGFHGRGVARVKVEYVGRAPLAGSDDRKLVATLRDGVPAQAPVQVAASDEEVPAEIIAVQIRKQGYECTNAQSAKRDPQASKPDEPVWILTCDNATYRVRLVGNMADHVEKL